MNLFNLTNELQKIESMCTDESIDEQMIQDTLEALNFEFEDKVDAYSRLIKQLENDVDAIQGRIEELETKLKRTKNLIKHLNQNLIDSFETLDKKEVSTELFTIKLQNNGGKAPIEPYKDDEVSAEYMKQIWVPDKDKIRLDLEQGKELTFTRLLPRGKHLSIK